MCGRVNVSDHPGVQQLLDFLNIPLHPDKFINRYNVAPGAALFSAFTNKHSFKGAYMIWGILPDWAKPEKFSRPLINARAETLWEKPSFRNLIKSQRIIIPINGFYEWQRNDKSKIAYHIQSSQKPALAVAGLYQITRQSNMQCCIITTAANQSMLKIHHRMPVIIDPACMNDWLLSEDKLYLNSLMAPCPNDSIELNQVSSYVNNASNEGPQCVEAPKQMPLI